MSRINFETIDIEEYLDSIGIPYAPSGSKNVGSGHIGISCPFCGDHEYSGDNHLGIDLNTKLFNCWICSAKGNLLKLVMKLEDCSVGEAIDSLRKFTKYDLSGIYQQEQPVFRNTKIELPEIRGVTNRVENYLQNRGFDANFLHQKYQIYDGGVIGRFKHRLVAPVYYQRRLVNLIGRDLTGRSPEKYIALPNTEAVLPKGGLLYNIDNAHQIAIVVEGPTDVWRIGNGAVALMTKKYTQTQLKLLSGFNLVYVLLDADAGDLSNQLANDLGAFTDVTQLELNFGDPAEMTVKEINDLRMTIFGKI